MVPQPFVVCTTLGVASGVGARIAHTFGAIHRVLRANVEVEREGLYITEQHRSRRQFVSSPSGPISEIAPQLRFAAHERTAMPDR